MKKYLLLLLILTTVGCSKSLIQLIETSSNNTIDNKGFWVFENDTVKITYSFWAENGLMAFNIYNKLDKPIYIDWKNSSFILEGRKLDYWIDEKQTNVESYYKGYYYGGPVSNSYFGVTRGTVVTSATEIKPERVTFIPPKSNYARSQFYLLPKDQFELGVNCQKIIEQRNDYPRRSTTVLSKTFDENTSPFIFRNYIAYTFSETSKEFVFIDNGFYMKSVKEMDIRHFNGKSMGCDENGSNLYRSPYKNGNSFWIMKETRP